MTAAEILRNAQPPADDALIEKAIADLDNKIWEWSESLKSAHAQLRSAFAVRPPAPRPSAALYENVVPKDLQAAAAAAHIAAPPPMPAEWTAPPPMPTSAPKPAEWTPPEPTIPDGRWAAAASHGGHGAGNVSGATQQGSAELAATWAPPSGPGSQAFQAAQDAPSASTGVMAWPSTPPANAWPTADASASGASGGAQNWPTWTPSAASGTAGGSQEKHAAPIGMSRSSKKTPRAEIPAGPTPEERAHKAAAEEAALAGLEDAIARRVRLLRRLDPDTAIEKLIEKAQQGQAEAAADAPAKDDKSSSWWRRK